MNDTYTTLCNGCNGGIIVSGDEQYVISEDSEPDNIQVRRHGCDEATNRRDYSLGDMIREGDD